MESSLKVELVVWGGISTFYLLDGANLLSPQIQQHILPSAMHECYHFWVGFFSPEFLNFLPFNGFIVFVDISLTTHKFEYISYVYWPFGVLSFVNCLFISFPLLLLLSVSFYPFTFPLSCFLNDI